MKNLFLLLALIFSFNAIAQDYKLIEEIRLVDTKKRVTDICNSLVASTPTKFRLFNTKESFNAGILRLRYVPIELSDADLNAGKFTEEQRQRFITIDFSFYNAGEDANAPRPDKVPYKFNQIAGAYPEIFAIWKKFFKPSATFEEAKTDAKLQYLTDRERNIDIFITQTEYGWALKTM